MAKKTGIAIQGGAGTILRSQMTPEKESAYKQGLEEALTEGKKILDKNKNSVDAVQKAVEVLENNILFNAGKGSVFTNEGTIEMDASIMDGKTLNAGCVSAVTRVRNPVLLARIIMDDPEFVFLTGKGAEEYAKKMNLKFEPEDYFFSDYRFIQLKKAKEEDITALDHSVLTDKVKDNEKHKNRTGTVGAVALDINGNLAAATSTGGMTNKKFGRIGDSPVIGAGVYANNKTCAVSSTGHGEYFLRAVTAYDVSAMMEYKGVPLKTACNEVLAKLGQLGGEGGFIAIDKNCNIEMLFNSEGMYRASVCDGEELHVEIYN